MIPFAPDRLSTMTGLPNDSESFWVIRRPRTSAGPPAGNGTTSLIGLVGYDCANAPMHQNAELSNVLIATTACTNRCALRLSGLSEFSMLPPRAMVCGESMLQEKGRLTPGQEDEPSFSFYRRPSVYPRSDFGAHCGRSLECSGWRIRAASIHAGGEPCTVSCLLPPAYSALSCTPRAAQKTCRQVSP